MSVKFGPDSPLGKQLAALWKGLKEEPGTRAELSRCKDVTEVMLTPVFSRFCQRTRGLFEGERPGWEVRLAMVVGLISHLKHGPSSRVLSEDKETGKSLAAQFVMPMAKGDRPKVSELRFRRLLQRDSGDLYPAMIRVLRMLEGDANLYGLAESVFYWGHQVKKDWSFTYFPMVGVAEKKSA